jgi:transcriptional regulator with XRE-family HTH domain
MSEPNTALRAVRQSMRMSQDEMARAVRHAGDRAGEPNDCSKRLVQRWEAGVVSTPRAIYARALEAVTGQPLENLGFASAEARYGLNRRQAMGMAAALAIPLAEGKAATAAGPLTGIWRSRYEYVSSGRDGETFADEHYVVVLHRGAKVQVRSLAGSAPSRLVMDLTANGQVITGTWTEETNPDGYYQGAVYHGAIQLLLEPTGHRMTGKWVGFGRDFDLNTGPWTLELVSSDVGKDAISRYSKPPEPAGP